MESISSLKIPLNWGNELNEAEILLCLENGDDLVLGSRLFLSAQRREFLLVVFCSQGPAQFKSSTRIFAHQPSIVVGAVVVEVGPLTNERTTVALKVSAVASHGAIMRERIEK